MKRYFILINPNTLEVVSAPYENQPLNSLPYAVNSFFKPCFDKYPNPSTLIEGATQAEIDAYTTLKEEAEDLIDLELLEAKGLELYHRTKKRLIRRRKKGLITANQAKKVREILNPIFQFLKTGDLDIALDKTNLLAVDLNANVQGELTWFKERLTEIQ